MSDAASTFGSAWEYKGLSLPQLTVKQYGIVERSARERVRKNIVGLLDDVKADVPNRITLLKEFDSRLPRLSLTAGHCETADGAQEAVVLSLTSGGMTKADAEAAIAYVAIADLVDLAMKVTTLDRVFPPDKERTTAGTLKGVADDVKK